MRPSSFKNLQLTVLNLSMSLRHGDKLISEHSERREASISCLSVGVDFAAKSLICVAMLSMVTAIDDIDFNRLGTIYFAQL